MDLRGSECGRAAGLRGAFLQALLPGLGVLLPLNKGVEEQVKLKCSGE